MTPKHPSPIATVPAALTGSAPAEDALPAFRPFGSAAADLDVEFEGRVQPEVISEILAACALGPDDAPPGREVFRRLGVGRRIEGLLRLLRLDGGGWLWAQLRCPNPACRAAIEVDLSPDELLGLADEVTGDVVEVTAGRRRLLVRKPTAADQLAWGALAGDDQQAALRAMAGSLVVGAGGEQWCPEDRLPGQIDREAAAAALDDAEVEAIQAALQEHDPLASFRLSVGCPACGQLREHDVDLAALLLGRLAEVQARLVEEVHALACCYGWTEREVLAVPARRRGRYLALAESVGPRR